MRSAVIIPILVISVIIYASAIPRRRRDGRKILGGGLLGPGEGSCSTAQFRCSEDSSCIAKAFKCDGDKDCPSGSDENGCGSNAIVYSTRSPPTTTARSWTTTRSSGARGFTLCRRTDQYLCDDRCIFKTARCNGQCMSGYYYCKRTGQCNDFIDFYRLFGYCSGGN